MKHVFDNIAGRFARVSKTTYHKNKEEEQMDMNSIEKILSDKKAGHDALLILSEMLAEAAPEDQKPVFKMPVYVNRITGKIGDFLKISKRAHSSDTMLKFATDACEFLQRVEDAVDAFLEQNMPEGEDND